MYVAFAGTAAERKIKVLNIGRHVDQRASFGCSSMLGRKSVFHYEKSLGTF
jgi:hypothetical protein